MFRSKIAILMLATAIAALASLGCVDTTGLTGTDTSGLTGSATNGQATFTQQCASCHTASSLADAGGWITNNMGTVSGAMRGITLTDQQIADLRSYLATR